MTDEKALVATDDAAQNLFKDEPCLSMKKVFCYFSIPDNAKTYSIQFPEPTADCKNLNESTFQEVYQGNGIPKEADDNTAIRFNKNLQERTRHHIKDWKDSISDHAKVAKTGI